MTDLFGYPVVEKDNPSKDKVESIQVGDWSTYIVHAYVTHRALFEMIVDYVKTVGDYVGMDFDTQQKLVAKMYESILEDYIINGNGGPQQPLGILKA
jgi:hypothetical protein